MASVDHPAVHPPPADRGEHEPEAPLRAYLQAKQAVAQLLREMQEFAQHAAPWATERVHDLMARLGEDRFQLVVVGQFKRGKSSLMNAIIGRPLLPTGTIPVTSAITSLHYGSTLRAVIKRADQAIDQEIPVSELPAFITERGNPENRKHVLSAQIQVPAAFLRRGLHFIDTPGIGSAHEHNTATTLSFLPEADAAIFVTAADGPMSDVELQFLDAVRQHVRKLFFVLNKIDQLSAEERDEAVAYTTDVLAKRLGTDSVRLFPFSATRAVAADRNDTAAQEASGLPAFETALATFLNDERRIVFLVAVLDRAAARLEEIRFMLGLRQQAIDPDSSTSDDRTRELAQRLDELEHGRQAAISQVAQQIADWQSSTLDPALERFAAEARDAVLADLPSIVEEMSATSRDYYARADECVRAELRERAATWLQSITNQVNEAARAFVRGANAEILSIIERPDDVAAAVFGFTEQAIAVGRLDPGTRWEWTAPPFTPQDRAAPLNLGYVPQEPSHAPVPHSVAVRLAVRWLSQRLAEHVERMGDALREIVLDHLHMCAAELDRSSEQRLAAERRRVEAVVKADTSGPESPTMAPADAVRELAQLLARVSALREALLKRESLPEVVLVLPPPAVERSGESAEEPHGAPREKGEGVVIGTCAICAVASDALFDFLCHYQYAIGHDAAAQREFLTSRGLCPTHTWHLERLSSPRGLSLGYPSLLDQMENRIKGITNLPATGAVKRIHELAAHTDACPACLARQRAEQRAAERLANALRTPEGRARFEQSQWLCLTHLQLLLTGVDDDLATMLLRVHARRFEEVSESMREFVIKHDARRRSLMTQEEERAYRRALVLLVGEKYLFRTESEE